MATSSKPSLRSFHSAALRTRSSKIPGENRNDAKRDSGDDGGPGPRGRTAQRSSPQVASGGCRSRPHRLVRHHHVESAAVEEFYGRLFDWNFALVQGSDQAVEIVARGEAIGTLRVADGKISPFNGVDLCSGDRHSGKLQEVAGAGWNSGSRVSLQPARRDWSHRPRPRSKWASGRHVLPNVAPIGSGPTQVTIPPRSGIRYVVPLPSRPEPRLREPGRHLASTTVGSDAGLATCRGALSGMRASPPRQRNPLSAR